MTTTNVATISKKSMIRRPTNGNRRRDRVFYLLHNAQFKTPKKTNSVALVRKDRA